MRSTSTDERLADLKDEVVRQGARIDGLEQTILAIGGRLFAGCIAITVAILGLAATQL